MGGPLQRAAPVAGQPAAGGRGVCLVHLGAGIGNVVLATPLLVALYELGFVTDVALTADYGQTPSLLQPWAVVRRIFVPPAVPGPAGYDHVLPALPPFYAGRLKRALRGCRHAVRSPPDALFYQHEQAFYLHFARELGYPSDRQSPLSLPVAPTGGTGVTVNTVVIAPGCKTGEMAAKRWPHYAELVEAFPDVAVVGTPDDLTRRDGTRVVFPGHARSFVGQLSLRETAELMAAAGVVVGNDIGLCHVAAALGTPTVMLFGPTPDAMLGPFPPNVRVLRRGLACEPCWFRDRFRACAGRIDCLAEVDVQTVVREVGSLRV